MSEPNKQAEKAVGAFNEGFEAFLEGLSDDTNPYQNGTALHYEWESGWDSAYEIYYREVQSDEKDKELLKRRT